MQRKRYANYRYVRCTYQIIYKDQEENNINDHWCLGNVCIYEFDSSNTSNLWKQELREDIYKAENCDNPSHSYLFLKMGTFYPLMLKVISMMIIVPGANCSGHDIHVLYEFHNNAKVWSRFGGNIDGEAAPGV